MHGRQKRKRGAEGPTGNGGEQEERSSSYQTLPVADLPPDFDGVPLDGAQYLAVVRKESSAVPSICCVPNPYAATEGHLPSSRKGGNAIDSTVMPSSEWRTSYLKRFLNMRNTLASRPTAAVPACHARIPRSKNGKVWFKFLHGSDHPVEVEYDDEQGDDHESCLGNSDRGAITSARLEPSEAVLHQLTSIQIMNLLSLIPYWLTQPRYPSENYTAIDPFHSRWLFSLLAHLDEHLVGDDISLLRTLARACLACIIQFRVQKGSEGQKEGDTLQQEMGAWVVIAAVVGVWGQHDLWDDGRRDLEQCAKRRLSAALPSSRSIEQESE